MPKHNYQNRLNKAKARRTDPLLNKTFLTESFNRASLPQTVRYVFESMRPIEPEYTKKTYEEAERVQKQISSKIPYGINVTYEYQGSVPLNTHIRLHSDLDILTLHDNFFSLEPPLKASNPYTGDAVADLKRLRENVFSILQTSYPAASVKNDSAKAISISGGSLARKFDLIVCNWYNTVEYHNSFFKTDDKRGIMIYDKKKNERFIDHPFTHIANVEEKNRASVGENFKRIIRLLKVLKADADTTIDLSSFMITSVMYHMEDYKYAVSPQNSTALLVYASEHLEKIINNELYRKSLDSPNKKEKLFAQDDQKKVAEFKKLQIELDDTIEDLAEEIAPSIRFLNEGFGNRMSVKNYYRPLQNAVYSY